MEAGEPSSIDALLLAAHRQFAEGLPGRVAALEEHIALGAWDEARRTAHRLRGSSATYGFAALASSAAAIEEALVGADAPGDEARACIAANLVEARAEAARAAASGEP
jgi:HPt (histidine-containing phosphotransfer) domain-containing protein